MVAGDPQATVDAYFDGVNAERYEDVAGLFAPGGELRAPGIRPTRGPGPIAAYLRAALEPFSEHRDEPTRTILAGSTATVEVHFSGALPSGARLEFDGVDIFDFEPDGGIALLTTWYDSSDVRKRLRAARAGGTP